MPWLFSVVNDRSSRPAPTPSAYSSVSRSVHSNSIGSLTAPTALGSIAIGVSFRGFSAPNHRKPFPPAPSAGQAIDMRKGSVIAKGLAVLAAAVIVGACGGGSPQVRSITITFVRHAQADANAGWFEGKPISMDPTTYLLAPADWLAGDTQNSIPGSVSGKVFNDRFTAAVQKIYDSGHSKPVVFAHLYSIEYWVLMNVKNAKDSLRTSHPLPNTGRVVITGSPATGWTLEDWDGIRNFNG